MDLATPFKSLSFKDIGKIFRARAKSGTGKGYFHEPNRMNRHQRRSLKHTLKALRQNERDELHEIHRRKLAFDSPQGTPMDLAAVSAGEKRVAVIRECVIMLVRMAKGPKMYPAVRKSSTPRTYTRT